MMDERGNNGNTMTTETYRYSIIELVEKIKPEYLKRLYKLVSYLYVWK